MKKTLFLLLILLITCCFVSCKKECFCGGGAEGIDDDGQIWTGHIWQSFGKLSNTDCKNLEGLIKIERDEERGCTITYHYGGCQLQ